MNSMPKIALIVIITMFGYIASDRKNPLNFSGNQHVDAFFQRCTGFCNRKFCTMYHSCRPANRTSKLKRLDIYFHEGVKLEAPIMIEVSMFKKFATQYRPLMFTGKEEFCKQLSSRSHPLFAFFGIAQINGSLFDPCPMSGHRYEAPMYTNTWISTLVPTGEWRLDFNLTKVINGTEEHIWTMYHYYLVKAKDATEF